MGAPKSRTPYMQIIIFVVHDGESFWEGQRTIFSLASNVYNVFCSFLTFHWSIKEETQTFDIWLSFFNILNWMLGLSRSSRASLGSAYCSCRESFLTSLGLIKQSLHSHCTVMSSCRAQVQPRGLKPKAKASTTTTTSLDCSPDSRVSSCKPLISKPSDQRNKRRNL